MDAHLAGARIPVQVDVGFGDAIVPGPTRVSIPGLLDFPAPVLTGYTRYTAVAEKFEAMLKLGEVNSRMKDFYDIWVLCRRFEFDGAQLMHSIRATCERRETVVPAEVPVALSSEFAAVPGKKKQWQAFINKLRPQESPPSLPDVIELLRSFLWPPTLAVQADDAFDKTWPPSGSWH